MLWFKISYVHKGCYSFFSELKFQTKVFFPEQLVSFSPEVASSSLEKVNGKLQKEKLDIQFKHVSIPLRFSVLSKFLNANVLLYVYIVFSITYFLFLLKFCSIKELVRTLIERSSYRERYMYSNEEGLHLFELYEQVDIPLSASPTKWLNTPGRDYAIPSLNNDFCDRILGLFIFYVGRQFALKMYRAFTIFDKNG